jgi:hypothetical protein
MLKYIFLLTALLIAFLFMPFGATGRESPESIQDALTLSLSGFVKNNLKKNYDELFPPNTKIERVLVTENTVKIFFSREITFYPLRPETITQLKEMFLPLVESQVKNAELEFYIRRENLEDYIPPVFKKEKPGASWAPEIQSPPWVKRASSPLPPPSAGLYGRHLVLWGSHGWYYDATTDLRWEWQRPRMFTIVEDLLPTSFMIPFILPMVENAGAVTCYLRERDYQTNEVLVDDQDAERFPQRGVFRVSPQNVWKLDDGTGFQNGLAPYPDNLNPHEKGLHTIVQTADTSSAHAFWIPNIPEKGKYGIYVSYNMSDTRAPDAQYIVRHLGGTTEFRVNQQMGGNTWVYLGAFLFEKGMNQEKGCVELTNKSSVPGATVSADCVKFGGGMGDIIREGTTSGHPRYCEGSRYWLQYAGVKPELVYKLGFRSRGPEDPDYTEDYVCRAEYANYLKGAPYGPNKDRNFPGLKVPIDLCFAFHTDAGIKDGIVGTLTVYRVRDDDDMTTFPNGEDRLENNRMFADLIQSEIVNTARAKYTASWTRRQLRDTDFSETRRGNMPSCLLELLSHQNFHDMQYALDPRFRFDISRAIYKAMLRFIAFKNGYEPVIEPLAPTHFRITRQSESSALLEWKAQPDPLEPLAMPDGYIVYKRTGNDESLADFDEGVLVNQARHVAEKLDPDLVYSFRIAAYNAGGKSFPSEVLCVRTGKDASEKRRCLIVNAFDRIAPPSDIIKEGYSGFDRLDKGVGYMANFGLTGDTWDYDPKSKFRTNDAPGHGASHGDLETKMELGNTFDFAIRHGAALAKTDWGFDSASDEAIREGIIDLKSYPLVDWLLGEERTTEPPKGFTEEGAPDKMKPEFKALEKGDQELIADYLKQGGAIFISGAYVATDLAGVESATDQDKKFLEETLKVYWTTNHGCKTNDVFAPLEGAFKELPEFHISAGIGEDGIYGVELPDSLKPAVAPKDVKDFETSETVLRYKENGWSAAIAMQKPRKVVVFGFPFECVVGAENRAKVMKAVVEYFKNQ